MENTNETEYVKEREVEIIGVSIDILPRTDDKIRQVRFKTKEFDITYKPKIRKTEFNNGIEVSRVVEMGLNELPKIIQAIASKVAKSGKATVQVCYGIFETEKDGQDVTYRYIRYESELAKWQLK